MITAEEARELTRKSAEGAVSYYCKAAIEEAISKGKYKVTIDLSGERDSYGTAQILVKALKELGYKASYYTGSQLDPCNDLIIEW